MEGAVHIVGLGGPELKLCTQLLGKEQADPHPSCQSSLHRTTARASPSLVPILLVLTSLHHSPHCTGLLGLLSSLPRRLEAPRGREVDKLLPYSPFASFSLSLCLSGVDGAFRSTFHACLHSPAVFLQDGPGWPSRLLPSN